MRFVSSVAVAFAGLLLVGSARAESQVPSNYIDDFGSLTPSSTTEAPRAAAVAHASPVASNYVDDFGSLEPSTPAGAPKALVAGHSSPVPLNYIDDFGVDQEISAESQMTATIQAAPEPSSIPRS